VVLIICVLIIDVVTDSPLYALAGVAAVVAVSWIWPRERSTTLESSEHERHGDDVAANEALDEVERLAEAGELAAAARRVTEVEVHGPHDAWRLGRVLELALERSTEAEPLYRQAVEAVPEAIVDLTLLLDETGRAAEADEILRALPGEEEAACRVKRGRALRAEGEVERALAEYTRGVELEDPVSLRYLAGTLSHEGAVDEALRWYTDPPFGADDPALRLEYVDLLQDLGERDAAVTELTALRERGVPDADRILGDIFADEDKIELAVTHYLAAIDAGDAKALTNLGVTWRETGRLVEAEVALRRSWRDGDVLAGRSLGRLLAQTGRGEEARGVWHQAAAAGDEPSGELLAGGDR
jgi:tetratricopeptide (TPR) repeat protein